MGVSGREMIEALIAGESDPRRLARLAHRRIKATRRALCEALDGRVTDHHRFRLRLHLGAAEPVSQLDPGSRQCSRSTSLSSPPSATRQTSGRSRTPRDARASHWLICCSARGSRPDAWGFRDHNQGNPPARKKRYSSAFTGPVVGMTYVLPRHYAQIQAARDAPCGAPALACTPEFMIPPIATSKGAQPFAKEREKSK